MSSLLQSKKKNNPPTPYEPEPKNCKAPSTAKAARRRNSGQSINPEENKAGHGLGPKPSRLNTLLQVLSPCTEFRWINVH